MKERMAVFFFYGGGMILALLAVACMVWVIYDVFFVEKDFPTERKILWAVLAILFSVLTAILYYLIEKKDKKRRSYAFLP